MLSAHLQEMALAFVMTVAIEATILMIGLSRVHPLRWRLFAGIWLTSCTYPILWLTLYSLFSPDQRLAYTIVGEGFVAVAECMLFYLVFDRRSRNTRAGVLRDMLVIVIANAASYGAGEFVSVRSILEKLQ